MMSLITLTGAFICDGDSKQKYSSPTSWGKPPLAMVKCSGNRSLNPSQNSWGIATYLSNTVESATK
jgi:hypothetical protein